MGQDDEDLAAILKILMRFGLASEEVSFSTKISEVITEPQQKARFVHLLNEEFSIRFTIFYTSLTIHELIAEIRAVKPP